MKSWDVIIAGAGIIGVSLALELRERGHAVMVLDRAGPAVNHLPPRRACWLRPIPKRPPPCDRWLCKRADVSRICAKLETAGKMQVDFRRVGTIALLPDEPAPAEYRPLSADELQRLEPSLKTAGQSAFFVQEDSVDPSLLMQAALAAAHNLGVEIRGHAEVRTSPARQRSRSFHRSRYVHRAFRGRLPGRMVRRASRPRKGQMLYVQPQTGVLQHVLRAPDVYLVPRSTGKILIGATVEDVGYDKSVDPSAIHSLFSAAAKYLPELASAPITQSWAGLRPGTPDDLPILGPTEMPGVFIASGHFRNGILLAPITAKIMADLVEGRPSPLDISAFAPSRFRKTLK